MDKKTIKKLIDTLDFAPIDGASEVYAKVFPQHGGYSIDIDFNTECIVYPDSSFAETEQIRVCDNTTSNFAKPENFVVLECVIRLLEKGYAPSCIELERKYPLGRREKGRLDILVKRADGTPYVLIECKTWESEYDKEQLLMNRTGGQLFSYYANERGAQYLCLYTSKLGKCGVEYKNAIVPVESDWTTLSGTKEIVAAWNGSFKKNGIFESDRVPYNVVHTALTQGELQPITEEHSEKIFDLIMEILRHNVVSDKPNAFNKLLNLFVCKIIDEDRQPDEVVDFQLLEDDGTYSLQMRLNDLYQRGMQRYLNIRVTDYSESEIEALTDISDEVKRYALKEAITKLRLQKNPEFAFVEVCDDKTFETNDKVLREIVGLLQGFKFRYAQKHQFLGDFFELLLSTSIKQESGQFFTPPPITRFILSSLPLKSKVESAVAAGKDDDFLPTVIDYACGSGHFLTEYLERMQNIIDSADFSKSKPSIRKMVRQYQDEGKFSWAKEYVYGVDLDYRLVKTTKVSAFFNGDGEAKIMWANGLGSFTSTPEYLDKLRNVSRIDKRDNATFDILISNPPYSVEAFKSTLDCGAETFELFDLLTDKSKEIECLFVERMKHLLKPGGWAGVILPSPLLTNGGIHAKTREILFKYFRFVSIVELGSGTFMKTGANTVILFLERRENMDWQVISRAIDKFFIDKQDVTVLGIETPFAKYVSDVRGECFVNYVKFIETADKDTIAVEKDKLLYFILTYSQTIVLVKAGKKQIEREFLGYEFSERRGREGLRPLAGGGKLFDETDQTNPSKVNSYIHNAFLKKEALPVCADVARHLSYERLSSLINYKTSIWNKQVFLVRTGSQSVHVSLRCPQIPLGDVCDIVIGGTPSRNVSRYYHNGTNLWVSIAEMKGQVIVDTKEKITDEAVQHSNVKVVPKGTTLLSFKLSIGKLAIAGKDLFTNEAIAALIPKDTSVVSGAFLFHLFSSRAIDLSSVGDKVFGKSLNSEYLRHELRIPLPSFDLQRQIVLECKTIDEEYEPILQGIDGWCREIDDLFSKAQMHKKDAYSFADSSMFSVNIGKRVLKTEVLSTGIYPVYSANVFEPFGHIDKLLLTDFSMPSVLWGIDGDWMTAYMPSGVQFYPTDHCGVLRVLSDDIHPRYLTWVLGKAGEEQEFSRSRRASVDRIKSLSVSLPSFAVQKRTVDKVFELEQRIADAKQALVGLDEKRKGVLAKFL